MKLKIIKLLAVFATVIAIGLGITIFCAWYTNGWESVSPFYTKQSGVVTESELTLTGGNIAAIEVCSAGFKKSVTGYTVQIMPDTDNDFDYTVNGLRYRFSAAGDLSEAFKVKLYDGYFTFTPYTPKNLINGIYSNAEIEILDKLSTDKSYYKIVITSADGKRTVILSLKVIGRVTSIKFDTDNIIL